MDTPVCFRDAVVAMERAAATFYRKLARRKEGAPLREVLEYLANQEEEHSAQLADIVLENTCSEELAQAFDELRPLLGYIIDEGNQLEELLDALDDREKILKLALHTEQNSMLFYSQMASRLRNAALQLQLRRVVEEENEHFNTFFKVLRILEHAEKGPWRSVEETQRLLNEAVAADHKAARGSAPAAGQP